MLYNVLPYSPYPAIVGSGTLDLLLSKGFKYMFVPNSNIASHIPLLWHLISRPYLTHISPILRSYLAPISTHISTHISTDIEHKSDRCPAYMARHTRSISHQYLAHISSVLDHIPPKYHIMSR